MTRGFTLLLAVLGTMSVSNLYWAQPLLPVISAELGVSTESAGLLVTATQLGYALGILLIVPLGDLLDRKRLVPLIVLSSVIALLACATAPTFGLLVAAIALLGFTSVAGQLVIPLAGDLADDASRGQVVATVIAGFLAGTLLSRAVSGALADAIGWRSIFVAAALVALVLAWAVHRHIPVLAPRATLRYPALLASIGTLVRENRTVRWTLALSATQFCVFMMFWTALTYLLSSPPFDYPVSAIGVFGLLGLFGVVAAQHTGRLHDRGWSLPAIGVCWVFALVSLAILAFAPGSLAVLITGVVLLHLALFPVNVLIAARLFGLTPQARSRVNTALVCLNFVAAALGSAAAGALWSAGGWLAIVGAMAALCVVGLALWALGRRGPLA